MPVTVDDLRTVALVLPRATEGWTRDVLKLRVGRLVFAALSADERHLGFAFPRDERDALIAAEPAKFLLPRPSEMRYQWVVGRMEALDLDELRELITDGWTMCVPKSVAAAWFADQA